MNAYFVKPQDCRFSRPLRVRSSQTWARCRCGWFAVWLVAAGISFAAPVRGQEMKAKTLERCKSAAVMVWTAESKREKADTKLGSGSGAFINSTGLLFTNNHVVDPVSNLPQAQHDQWHYEHNKLTWQVITDAGTDEEETWDAVVIYQNAPTDLAILQAFDKDEEKLQTPDFLRFLPEARLEERMKLWAFGFPGGDAQKTRDDKAPEVTVTDGHILKIPRTPAGRIPIIYTDVLARPGNSGGATVNKDGLLVGVVTRLAEPEGRLSIGGMKKTGLVPGNRVHQMVWTAVTLGKTHPGTDYAPFVEVLVDENDYLNIPEYRRLPDHDVLFFDDGDRIYGEIEDGTITWKLRIGELTVPTSTVAYVLNNQEGSHLFLEGGNRAVSSGTDATLEFVPQGGEKTSLKFSRDDIRAVAFRTSGRQVKPIEGKLIVLDTELSHLRLRDVRGTVRLEGKIGHTDVKLEDIKGIESSESGDGQILLLRDGRRITGKFTGGTYQAKIADNDTPFEFGLENVEEAQVVIEIHRPHDVAGLGLPAVLASADRNVKRILETMESGDTAGARAAVEALVESEDFKRMPEVKKGQVHLLAAAVALRHGDAEAAPKLFRKCLRAEDENVSVYAGACNAVLKRYDDFKFEDKPLSDQASFVAAGSALADEYIQQVRDLLKDARNLKGEQRAEYVRGINDVKKYEDHMKTAAVFRATKAEDELFRLWRYATTLCEREVRRIDQKMEEEEESGRRGSSKRRSSRRGGGSSRASERERDKLREQREEALETYVLFQTKLRESGYRIEDPDIQERREREAEEGGSDEQP